MPRSKEAIARAKANHNASGKPLLAGSRRRRALRLAVVVAEDITPRAAASLEEFTTHKGEVK